MLYSSVTLKEESSSIGGGGGGGGGGKDNNDSVVAHMAPFHTRLFPNSLALAMTSTSTSTPVAATVTGNGSMAGRNVEDEDNEDEDDEDDEDGQERLVIGSLDSIQVGFERFFFLMIKTVTKKNLNDKLDRGFLTLFPPSSLLFV